MNIRQTWADNAKLIGIFFVILGHNEVANKGIENWILTFHMPLFFLLSGYFVKGDPEPFRSWLAKYAKRLLVPYLFFHLVTFPYDAYKIWSSPELYQCEHWWQLITKPLAGLFTVKSTSYAIFTNLPCWFFVCLFIVAMLFYPAKRQGCTPRFLIGSSVLTMKPRRRKEMIFNTPVPTRCIHECRNHRPTQNMALEQNIPVAEYRQTGCLTASCRIKQVIYHSNINSINE